MRPATAVIVSYQSARTIRHALDAARRCHDEGLLDVVVIDNASTDGTRETLCQETRWIRFVPVDRNLGFARGCNVGLELVKSPYTIFINPDAVVEPDALRTLLCFMDEHPRAGIAGPAIIEGAPGGATELQDTGDRPTPWSIVRNAVPIRSRRPLSQVIVPGSEPFRTGWVCGAVLIARTSLLRRLRGFDPRFFLYWEEMDLCKRAESAGFEVWALGTALAHHVGGASSAADETRVGGCIARHYFQSRFYYMVKHHGWLAGASAESAEFLLVGARALLDSVAGRGLYRLRPRLQARLFSRPGAAVR